MNNQNHLSSEIMSREQVAAYLGICKTVLDRSDIPRIKITARRVIYRKTDVDTWLEQRLVAQDEKHF